MYNDLETESTFQNAKSISPQDLRSQHLARKFKILALFFFLLSLSLLITLVIVFVFTKDQHNNNNNNNNSVPASFAFKNIPLVRQQTDYTCGVASLSSCLQALGFSNVSEAELAIECKSNDIVGTEFARIVNASVNRNLTVLSADGWTLEDVKRWIYHDGGLVIVDYQAWIQSPKTGCDWRQFSCNWTQQQWQSNYNDGHYSVMIGWNESGILLMDPSQDPVPWDLTKIMPYGFISEKEWPWRWHDFDGYSSYTYHLGLAMKSSSVKLDGEVGYWPTHVEYTF